MALFSDIKHSVTYPFNDSNWLRKLWPLPLSAAMPLVGLVSIILLNGWRFEMVRNLANGVDDLPDFDLVLFFKRGRVGTKRLVADIAGLRDLDRDLLSGVPGRDDSLCTEQ